jgi:predicted ester cyclase
VSAEDNKALVRRFFEEAWGKGNLSAVDESMASDYVEHRRPYGMLPGPEGLKQLIVAYRSAFPDLTMTLDDIFAEGEMAAFRWSARGAHLGDWLGIPPTGNHVTATGITIFRIASGKVVESWTSIDLYPSDEELRWVTEGGNRWTRSSDIPPTRGDLYPPIWDVLTRNLTWRFRVAEAHDPHYEMFGFPRLRALVGEHGGADGSLVDRLLQELYSFTGEDWEQEDDITLVTLQRSMGT